MYVPSQLLFCLFVERSKISGSLQIQNIFGLEKV